MTDALYEMTKVNPEEPVEWLANFMLERNNNKPVICESNKKFLAHLTEIKAQEEVDSEQKQIDDNSPEQCGCYLAESSSFASSTAN